MTKIYSRAFKQLDPNDIDYCHHIGELIDLAESRIVLLEAKISKTDSDAGWKRDFDRANAGNPYDEWR